MKDVYRPRIDVGFRLTDGAGRTLRGGRRSLSDPSYLTRAVVRPGDPLRDEKAMPQDWFKREFAATGVRRTP